MSTSTTEWGLLRAVILLLYGPLASACSHGSAPEPVPTLASLQAEAVVAPCSTDVECRTVPVGTRACGGPEAYLPWSIRASGLDAWRARIAAYTAASARARDDGLMSTCVMQEDPGARCAQGRCVLEGRSASRLEQ